VDSGSEDATKFRNCPEQSQVTTNLGTIVLHRYRAGFCKRTMNNFRLAQAHPFLFCGSCAGIRVQVRLNSTLWIPCYHHQEKPPPNTSGSHSDDPFARPLSVTLLSENGRTGLTGVRKSGHNARKPLGQKTNEKCRQRRQR